MLPYFSFSVINYAIIFISLKFSSLASIAQMGSTNFKQYSITDCIFQIVTYQNSICKNLWFLYLLFVLSVLNILFPSVMKHPITTAILFCLPFISYTVQLPSIISYFFAYASYFSLGRLVLSYKDKIMAPNKPICFTSFAIFFIVGIAAAICKYLKIFDGNMVYVLIPIKALVACAAILTIYCACKAAERTKADTILSIFGKYSMEIYLIHFPFITQGSTALILKAFPLIPSIFACIVGTLLGLTIPVLLSKFVIKKIPGLRLALLGITN